MSVPQVMGIINCTPDSFHAASRRDGVTEVLDRALRMEAEGADIVDLGGESTRPGAAVVSAEEEIRRVVPAIRSIRKKTSLPISVDTRKFSVAEAALEAGATMINDVSALGDPRMGSLAAEWGVPVVLMHMRGNPATMQDDPWYDDVVAEVRRALLDAVDRARTAGLDDGNLILDPGIGFGKRHEDNLNLLRALPEFHETGFPVMVGLSRKSFLGRILDNRIEERLAGTLTAQAWCLFRGGVDYLRVHDVKETRDMIDVLGALHEFAE